MRGEHFDTDIHSSSRVRGGGRYDDDDTAGSGEVAGGDKRVETTAYMDMHGGGVEWAASSGHDNNSRNSSRSAMAV